jgi:hypothetical protein
MTTLQPKKAKGYLLSVFGGLCGAAVFTAVLTSFSEQVPGFLKGQSATSLAQSLILGIIVGLSLSEVVGCWAALRLGGREYARTTAAWLAVLFIPGWFIYMLLSLLLGSFLSAILLLVGLPLIARLFTNDPRFPGGFARALNTYTKRPFT